MARKREHIEDFICAALEKLYGIRNVFRHPENEDILVAIAGTIETPSFVVHFDLTELIFQSEAELIINYVDLSVESARNSTHEEYFAGNLSAMSGFKDSEVEPDGRRNETGDRND